MSHPRVGGCSCQCHRRAAPCVVALHCGRMDTLHHAQALPLPLLLSPWCRTGVELVEWWMQGHTVAALPAVLPPPLLPLHITRVCSSCRRCQTASATARTNTHQLVALPAAPLLPPACCRLSGPAH